MKKNSGALRVDVLIAAAFAFLGAFGTANAEWKVADDKARTTLDNIQKQNQVKGTVYNPSTKRSLNPYSDNDYPLKKVFPEREENAGVEERCPGTSRNPAKDKQNPVCTELVQWENRQYNYVIETLKVTKAREEELQRIYDERRGISADQPGALQSNTNRLLTLQAQQQIDALNTKAMMDGYASIIGRLRENVAQEGKKAMDGQTNSGLAGLGGAFVQSGALATALGVAKAARER